VHFFGFIVRIYHDARSSECQICPPVRKHTIVIVKDMLRKNAAVEMSDCIDVLYCDYLEFLAASSCTMKHLHIKV